MASILRLHGLNALILLATVLGIFFAPVVFGRGVVQWDAVGVHAAPLFEATPFFTNGMPEWSTSVFAGFPIGADPQPGFYYPVWFLAGMFSKITPAVVLAVLALHYLIAGLGAYAFVFHLTGRRSAALFSGLAFMISGQLLNHASHVGIVMTAAWSPWLLLAGSIFARKPDWSKAALLGSAGGLVFLIGHFQTFLYAMLLLGAWIFFQLGKKALLYAPLMIACCAGVAAVQLLPSLPLVKLSYRPQMSFSEVMINRLEPQTLPAFVIPNYQGNAFGPYTGQFDVTQSNLYIGLTTLLLFGIAIVRRPRREAVFFTCVALLFLIIAFGASTPLGALMKYFPVVNKIRSPLNGLVFTHLCLAVLAGLGIAGMTSAARPRVQTWLPFAACALLLIELLPLAVVNRRVFNHARGQDMLLTLSNERAATAAESRERKVALKGWRVFATAPFSGNQSMFHAVDAADGYNPLEGLRYRQWLKALESGSGTEQLLGSAGVAVRPCDLHSENDVRLCDVTDANPLFFASRQNISAEGPSDALTKVMTTKLTRTAVVEAAPEILNASRSGDAEIQVLELLPGRARFVVKTSEPRFFVFNESAFPGWEARINGALTEILPTNFLFQGIIVPGSASSQIVEFRFSLPYRVVGSLVTGLTLLFAGALLIIKKARNIRG
jgi:hypothetical protein